MTKLLIIWSAQYIHYNRKDITRLLSILTGHCLLWSHANNSCRSCKGTGREETIPHLLYQCPGLTNKSHKFMCHYILENLSNISRMELNGILTYDLYGLGLIHKSHKFTCHYILENLWKISKMELNGIPKYDFYRQVKTM